MGSGALTEGAFGLKPPPPQDFFETQKTSILPPPPYVFWIQEYETRRKGKGA